MNRETEYALVITAAKRVLEFAPLLAPVPERTPVVEAAANLMAAIQRYRQAEEKPNGQ